MDKNKKECKNSELIKELLTCIDEVRKMTDHDRNLMGDYKNDTTLRYPQTKSEYFVDKISTLLAHSDLVSDENEPILDEMLGLAGQLDIDVNQPEVWQDLFKLSDDLRVIK